jgi:hypothetical protein
LHREFRTGGEGVVHVQWHTVTVACCIFTKELSFTSEIMDANSDDAIDFKNNKKLHILVNSVDIDPDVICLYSLGHRGWFKLQTNSLLDQLYTQKN